ncbi:hypothetical protein DFH06DRAFT_1350016 [Mycena polygramma]|nr:hypothetical protein DFH06DRAFT_1350016 [Mycena polygramma]
MPLAGVIAVEPPLHLFVWPADRLSRAGKPEADVLIPAPPAPRPVFGCYPQAPEYVLNAELDRSYRRGWRYAAPFHTFNRAQDKQNMLEIQMPPNISPTYFDQDTCSFVADPIPGMVRLPLGIPLVHHIDGNPKHAVTAVCAHSMQTLSEYPEAKEIQQLVPRLIQLTWGTSDSGDNPGVPGIFELDGMQRNLRSKHVDPDKLAPGDGSFNLASTHGEGEGHGHFAPAVQTNTPAAAAIIKEVLQIIHRLYRLIMPLCVSRFEWDMMEFHGYENNVVAFGGIDPGPTSCQLNSSGAANVFDLKLGKADRNGIPTMLNGSSERVLPFPRNISYKIPFPPTEPILRNTQPKPAPNTPLTPTHPAQTILPDRQSNPAPLTQTHSASSNSNRPSDRIEELPSSASPVLLGAVSPNPPSDTSSSPGVMPPNAHPKPAINPPTSPDPADTPRSPDSANTNYSRFINLKDFLISLLKKSANLDTSIGPQGSPHGDFKDDALWFTLFVLLFRLPPGSDLGAFLWMRGGIYMRETDEYILFASFKAQDIHTGSAPTYIKEAMISMEQARELFERFGPQVRCGYVAYASRAATTHSTQLLYTPSLRFLYSPADPRQESRKYYATHGDTILGDNGARANRLAREGVYAIKNYFFQSAIDLGLDVDALLRNATYRDTAGISRRLDLPLLDVENDEEYELISLYRQYFFWWTDVISKYSLGVTKSLFKERQKAIKDALSGIGQHPKSLPTERNVLSRPRGPQITLTESDPLIASVISRTFSGKSSEAIWTVVLEGSSQELQVTETTPWLRAGCNSQKCLEYIKTHGTGPPVPVSGSGSQSQTTESIPADHQASVSDNLLIAADLTGSRLASEPDLSGSNEQTDPLESHNPASGLNRQPLSDPTVPPPLANGGRKRKRTPANDPAVAPPRASGGRKRKMTPLFSSSEDETLQKEPKSKRKRRRDGDRDITPLFLESEEELEDNTLQKGPEREQQGDGDRDITPLFLGSEEESDEEPEYEVEYIIDWQDLDGQRQWLVKWKGYEHSDNTWLSESQLSGAQELLAQFNAEHDVPAMESPLSSPLSSPPVSDDDSEYCPPATAGNADDARARRITQMLGPTSDNTPQLQEAYLGALLKRTVLEAECNELEATMGLLARPAEFRRLANETPRTIATHIVDQIERNNDLSTRMYFELPPVSASESSPWGSQLADLTLSCIADIGATLPSMIGQAHVHDLVSRGVRAQICRALIAIYQWLVHLGPSLAEQLMSIHKSQGLASLSTQFPQLAPMVDHIVGFVREHQTWQAQMKPKAKPKTKGKKGGPGAPRKCRVGVRKDPAVPSESPPSESLPAVPSESPPAVAEPQPTKPSTYSRIPANLYGLLPDAKEAASFALPALRSTVQLKTDDDVYNIAAQWLCKVWDEHLILKPMKRVDKHLNPKERETTARPEILAIRDRCIARGAILQCFADAFGDGLFACHSMQTFLRRPCRLFPANISRDEHFARAIERDEAQTLSLLDSYLMACMVEDSELHGICARLGELVHKGLLSLKLGHALTDEEYNDPYAYLVPGNGWSKLQDAANRSKTRRKKPLVNAQPTLATLLPDKPSFGIPAIIIREALSDRRNKDPTSETTLFRRLLTGHHPTTGDLTRRDRDQMDPIRADLEGFRLLKSVLPFHHLTTETGLSSLLVFMSTGQGSWTSDFLADMSQKPNKMHFSSLEECVEEFTVQENRQSTLAEAQQIRCCNPGIYGTANAWYSLHPSIRIGRNQYRSLTIREKFAPFFTVELGRSYRALLGPLADQDPETSDAPKIPWDDVLRWIVQTRLSGFGSGLAPLQFANNLALAGIAEPPSVETMAQWIYLNKGYGAFAGLKVTGWNLPDNASPAAVRAALTCFYRWHEHHLSVEDSTLLRFGTIFAEQLLCKCGRWKHRLKSMTRMDLSEKADELFEGKPWTQGENWTDHTKWPIPSCADFPLSVFRSIIEEGGNDLVFETEAEMECAMDVDK